MRLSFILFLFFLTQNLFSQTPEEDEVQFQSAVDWLDSKLSYLYYDEVGEKWWNNTFYVNDNKEITIKHISSSKPNTANIRSKTYTIRTFKIQDINPKSLKIKEVMETKGRIVKGKMLELRTYGFQDLIHKTINNRPATSTSFLFLSFPTSLTDSISDYAEIAKRKFEEAILASTQLYPSGTEGDIVTIFDVLTGSFETDNGEMWKAEEIKPNVLKIDRGTNSIEYFGLDEENQQFYLLDIASDGIKKQSFQMKNSNKLSLEQNGETSFQFHTLHSFSYMGTRYFRK